MDSFSVWIVVTGILLAVAVNFIIDYNSIQRLKYRISQCEADIQSAKDLNRSLLEKAEKVTDKFVSVESDLYKDFAEARKTAASTPVRSARIKNGNDFRGVVESYPEMKSNDAIQKLLSQIEITEQTIYRERKIYSDSVAKFNTKIHTFPIVLIRRLCKWNDIKTQIIEEIVTDEELGI